MASQPIWLVGLTNSRWGNNIAPCYVDPIVRYCQSQPNFISHAKTLTPAVCQAIRQWAGGCNYPLEPNSSLGELVERQEKAYPSTNVAESISYAPSSSEITSGVSDDEMEEMTELTSITTTCDVAPDHLCRVNEAPASRSSGSHDLAQVETRETPPRASEDDPLKRSGVPNLPAQAAILLSFGERARSNLDNRANIPRIFNSLSLPSTLSIPENLFHAIAMHFEETCRHMTFDENEVILSPDGTEFRNNLCTDFDSYCFTATMLKEKELYVELGCTLSKASALVKPILRVGHPRSLACFFEVLIHLMQSGLPEVALTFRAFIKDMSASVRGEKNAWYMIYQLLGEVDPTSLVPVMAQGWKCATDVFERVLGTSHRLAVSVRLDYVKRVITNQSEEERILRDLLFRFEGIPRHPTPRVMLNLAHNLNRQGLHDKAGRMALDISYMLQRYEIYAGMTSERIECLKVLSHSQFLQGKILEAEHTTRRAVKLIVDQWGPQHPWAIEFLNVLEGWFRFRGCVEIATALRGEIESLIGHGSINNE